MGLKHLRMNIKNLTVHVLLKLLTTWGRRRQCWRDADNQDLYEENDHNEDENDDHEEYNF